MARLLFAYVIPLVLPTAVYILWRTFAPRRAGGSETIQNDNWEDLPWTWLSVAGVALLAATLGAMAVFTGGEPGSGYVPPRLEGDEVLPGRIVPPPDGR